MMLTPSGWRVDAEHHRGITVTGLHILFRKEDEKENETEEDGGLNRHSSTIDNSLWALLQIFKAKRQILQDLTIDDDLKNQNVQILGQAVESAIVRVGTLQLVYTSVVLKMVRRSVDDQPLTEQELNALVFEPRATTP